MARDYQPDRRGMNALMRGPEMQSMCMQVGADHVPTVAAHTPKDTGETAASTRAVEDRMPDGTAGAAIVQGGASVPANFGNQHVRGQYYLQRVFGNGA